MERFVVRKNTLPYVHQWAVIDTVTGKKVVEYKIQQFAKKACRSFNQYGLPDTCGIPPENTNNAWNAASERMKHPEGDPPPKKKPQHSDKRPVELD